MNTPLDQRQRLLRMERMLAGLLRYGALVACVWIALGMALSLLTGVAPPSRRLVAISDRCLVIGVVSLVALPVIRVGLTAAIFFHERDYRFAAIAGAVLFIIALGFVLGTLDSHLIVP